jgi:RNA binding exosome subunit
VLRARLREAAAVEAAMDRIARAAGPQLVATLGRRVDDEGRLFARLDKQAASRGQVQLLEDPENDVIKFTAKPRARPRNRAQGLAAYRERLAGPAGEGARAEEE